MSNLVNDPYFKVSVLSKTERPNLLCYRAMHQCVAEEVMSVNQFEEINESELGNRVVQHCIKQGHHSVIEHPSISFLVQGYPHKVMVQLTRHRHNSFSVQSQRYTGERIINLYKKYLDSKSPIEDFYSLFYTRPLGEYKDRKGNTFNFTEDEQYSFLQMMLKSVSLYYFNTKSNMPFEMARDFLSQGIRQDFVVTMNPRSLLHFLDLRTPKDAELEIRDLAYRLFDCFTEWMPEVAEWYQKNRLGKNKLAP